MTTQLQQITEMINERLSRPGTHRFSVVNSDGEYVIIRISDHCANVSNNKGFTLSFISRIDYKDNNAFKRSNYEWVIENGMTENYESVSEILQEFGIESLVN